MEVSEARRLKQLEDENRRLKALVAELSLDNRFLKDIASGNSEARRRWFPLVGPAGLLLRTRKGDVRLSAQALEELRQVLGP